MKEFFTTHDVAVMLGITRVTVRNWVLKGRIKAGTTKGGHRRIRRGELERFFAANGFPVDLIREYELLHRKRFLFCWEYHNLGLSTQKVCSEKFCQDCLVYKFRAQKCHLLLKKLNGDEDCEHTSSCSQCSYFAKYLQSDSDE